MKALSIHADNGVEIMAGRKTDEFRSWQTDYRGDLLICASVKPCGPEYLHGHAIGVVELADIVRDGAYDFVWKLRRPRLINPFPVKGKLHLYEVDEPITYWDFRAAGPEADTEAGRYRLWARALFERGLIRAWREL